jgi:hypothetical protein
LILPPAESERIGGFFNKLVPHLFPRRGLPGV